MPYRKKWRSLRLAIFVRQEWPSFLMVTAGTVIFTVGLLSLTIPYRFPDAGVSGLAVLANYAAGINPAWVIITCNVGLLIWGWRELSPRFVIWTTYTIVLLSLLLKVLEGFPALPLQDRLLVAILAGVVKGLGVGLIFRASSSLGGTDIIVMSLRKRFLVEHDPHAFMMVGDASEVLGKGFKALQAS